MARSARTALLLVRGRGRLMRAMVLRRLCFDFDVVAIAATVVNKAHE